MPMSLNEATLAGNLGRDPEIRTTNAGKRVASFSLATNKRWTDSHTGEVHERTEWHRVVVFHEGLVGVIEKYVSKGSSVFLRGELQTRKWTDQSGNERYTTEVVVSGPQHLLKLNDAGQGNGGGSRPPAPTPSEDYPDDDIPF